MKTVCILIIAAASLSDAAAQSAPGPAPTIFFPSCNSSNCTAANSLNCAAGSSNTITSFNDKLYITGTGSGPTSIGAQWKFYDVAADNSDPSALLQVNAIITIESAYRAYVVDFDNDNAEDENGNNTTTMRNLFAPTISADQILTDDSRAGYVQFRIRFFKNIVAGSANKWDSRNYSDPIELSNLNYVHYDIDGVTNDGRDAYELRETGVINTTTTPATVTANANTELNPYSYSGDGAIWRGYMGSICNREHTSQCSQVVASFGIRGAYSSVVFRMGYNYVGRGNGLNDGGVQDRLYASTFGCFSFPAPILLPVRLISFNGSYHNNVSSLSWETESEVNFDHYEIEKSNNGSDYIYTGRVAAQTGNSKKIYGFTDNLASTTGSLFYYRLKMVDIDGNYKYSNVLLIRRDGENSNNISVSPSPVLNGNTPSIRISSATAGKVDIRIIDLAGKIVLQQQSRLSAGINSISINNLTVLKTGMYAIQVLQNGQATTAKFAVLR